MNNEVKSKCWLRDYAGGATRSAFIVPRLSVACHTARPYNKSYQMETISIRPGFIPYTLSAAVLITAGSQLFKNDLLLAAVVCWSLLVPVILAAMFDRIEFDGSTLRHRGPLAFIL